MSGRNKDYPSLILESLKELQTLERVQKQSRTRDYVRFIGYLKEGSSTSQVSAGARIGLKARQSQVIWSRYSKEGLSALLSHPFSGTVGKLSYIQITGLQSFLRDATFNPTANCRLDER